MGVAREEEGTRSNGRISGRPRGSRSFAPSSALRWLSGSGLTSMPAGSARVPTLLPFRARNKSDACGRLRRRRRRRCSAATTNGRPVHRLARPDRRALRCGGGAAVVSVNSRLRAGRHAPRCATARVGRRRSMWTWRPGGRRSHARSRQKAEALVDGEQPGLRQRASGQEAHACEDKAGEGEHPGDTRAERHRAAGEKNIASPNSLEPKATDDKLVVAR